jgi:FMN-dependent NADH-azoreductase
VILSRGGIYSEGPAAAIDFQEPYLKQLLLFIGITDVTFIRAEKVSFGPEAREGALAFAKESIAEFVQRIRSETAVISLEPTAITLAA